MEIEDILVRLKIFRERIEGNTRYVGQYYLNRTNPLTYVALILFLLQLPILCLFTEASIQEGLIFTYKGIKDGGWIED